MSENKKKHISFIAEIEENLKKCILEQYESFDEDNKKIADIWLKDGANVAKLVMLEMANGNETILRQMFD
tara:strand:+ start:1261 stop:1470 length:210 start_codon:yes stop_codon:yes gene_type:complete